MSGWSPPKRLGKYELVAPIGQGGMGAVWRARQADLGRDVAIKVMLAGEHASEEMLARFRREARLAAKLQDPGIVTVFDVGQEGPLHYFVMELVEGQSLKELVAKGPLPVERAVSIAVDAAKALAAAHDVGVIHRDVKPGNILIDGKGRVRVADFGLAKDVSDPKLTTTGTVFGTPSYMAPEQAGGDVSLVSARSDVYSLGAVLYEMLTGRPPFEGTFLQVLKQVESQAPRAPSSLNRAVPKEVEAVVLRALAKDPGERFADARAFAIALGSPSSMRATVVRTRPTPSPARRRLPAWAAWVAIAALLVPVGVWFLFLQEPASRPKHTIPPQPGEREAPAKETVGLRRVLDWLAGHPLRWAAVGAMALPSDRELRDAKDAEPEAARKELIETVRLAWLGDQDQAWTMAAAAPKSDPDAALVFAEVAILRHRWTGETEALTQALSALAPYRTPEHVALRAVVLISSEAREAAEEVCLTLDGLLPGSPIPHLVRALHGQGKRDFPAALAELEKARLADPKLDDGGYGLFLGAYSRFLSGTIDRDAEWKAIESAGDARWPMTHLLRAWARALFLDWDGVARHMREYVKVRPPLWPALEPYELHELAAAGDSPARQALAALHTHLYLDGYDEAIQAGERAIDLAEEIEENDEREGFLRDCHFYLARVCVADDHPETARSHVKEAHRLGATREFLEEQEGFQSLRGEEWDRLFEKEDRK